MPENANIEKLMKILGFDPTREQGNSQVLADALQEITKERNEVAKQSAKKLLTEAMDLHKQMKKCESQFKNEMNKFDKNLGKLVSRIESIASGKPAVEETEEKNES